MNDLIKSDLQHIWHPCSQMKDYESFQPLTINKAQGCYLQLANGQRLIDAFSSWWCKSLGHGHPELQQAVITQMQQFEHVTLANTTHSTIVELGEKLACLMPGLSKAMFASDGSCAVEMALKMSLHAKQLCGQKHRQKFIALKNGYHGETVGCLSVSDLGLYRQPYAPLLFDCVFIDKLPYVSGEHDPLWQDCSAYWPTIEAQLAPLANTACAMIVEPVVQGAGNMRIYSADLLRRLNHWCKSHDIYFIADEIMTGIGRTGLALACQHANITADFMCLSKGLTAGFLPLSAMLTTDAIYDLFYDDYATHKAFMHSHTYTGHALAAKVACTTLNIMQRDNWYQRTKKLQHKLRQRFQAVAEQTQRLHNIRGIGAMVAGDLITNQPRMGYQVYQQAIKQGALLRPLGNTLYWMPPFIIEDKTLDELADITTRAIKLIFR